jgi:Aspartyl protease
MKKIFFLVIGSLFLFCSHTFASDIPFTIEKGYLVVSAKIKKDIPVEVIIATGSDVSIVDSESVKKYELRSAYTGVGIITGKNDRTVVFSDVSDLSIGDEKSKSLLMKIVNIESIRKKIGRDIFGILGSDFLKGKTLRIDFKKKVLNFVTQPKQKDDEVPKNPNRFVFKMDYLQQNIFGAETTLPVSTEITINGKKAKLLFDTGIPFPIAILPFALKDLGLDMPDKETIKSSQIKSLKMFEYEMNDIPSVSIGKNSSLDRDTKEYGSILGLGVLQNFVVTFDYKNKLIILER